MTARIYDRDHNRLWPYCCSTCYLRVLEHTHSILYLPRRICSQPRLDLPFTGLFSLLQAVFVPAAVTKNELTIRSLCDIITGLSHRVRAAEEESPLDTFPYVDALKEERCLHRNSALFPCDAYVLKDMLVTTR